MIANLVHQLIQNLVDEKRRVIMNIAVIIFAATNLAYIIPTILLLPYLTDTWFRWEVFFILRN